MTPLAHRIVKELTLPLAERERVLSMTGLAESMGDVVCFELTEVYPLIVEIAQKFRDLGMDGKFAFLPAPKTWIEWKMPGLRSGSTTHGILIKQDTEAVAVFSRVLEQKALGFHQIWPHTEQDDTPGFWELDRYSLTELVLPLEDNLAIPRDRRQLSLEAVKAGWSHLSHFEIYAALAIINSPRLIGRKQHMPHRGLERRLANAKGIVGKFPLHAWTELKLSVADIGKRADGSEHEAHYTGEKCLHFCRSHLRIRNGRLERVSAHWRGNPALGIKRTRYAVTA